MGLGRVKRAINHQDSPRLWFSTPGAGIRSFSALSRPWCIVRILGCVVSVSHFSFHIFYSFFGNDLIEFNPSAKLTARCVSSLTIREHRLIVLYRTPARRTPILNTVEVEIMVFTPLGA